MLDKNQLNFFKYNDIICLDLSSTISYKQKKSLIDLITSKGFRVSFVLNKKAKLLLKDDKNDINTYKCRTAFKLGLPVLHIKFIYDYISTGSSISNTIEINDYLIVDKENDKNFNNGLISFNNKQSIFIIS
jgi:hypothetical protein